MPPLPQLAPVFQTTVMSPSGYVPRMWSVAADGQYVYVLLYHARPSNENDTSGPGELLVLRRDGLAELRRVPVGLQPRRVVVDTRNDRVYVLNRLSGSVGVLDRELLVRGDPDPLVGEAVLGFAPVDVAVDPGRNLAYVPSANKTIQVLDGATGVALPDRAIPMSSAPMGVAYDELSDTIYATLSSEFKVVALRGDTHEQRADVAVPRNSTSRALALLPARQPRFVPAEQALTTVYAVTDGSATARTPSGLAVGEFTFAADAAGRSTRGATIPTLPVKDVAVDRHLRHVHVAEGNRLSIFDAGTATRIAEQEFHDAQSNPLNVRAVGVSPADSRVYLTTDLTGAIFEYAPGLWPAQAPRAPLGAELAVTVGPGERLYTFVVGEDQQMHLSRYRPDLDNEDWSAWVPWAGGSRCAPPSPRR